MNSVEFQKHDHDQCRTKVLRAVQSACDTFGLRMTPVRQHVLDILLESHKAMGAYEILDRLRAANLGSQPPVVYRALDFLVQHGFVHKIELLNAFVACNNPDMKHDPVFLICRHCNRVAQSNTQPNVGHINNTAKETGFAIEHIIREAIGECPNCQGTGTE